MVCNVEWTTKKLLYKDGGWVGHIENIKAANKWFAIGVDHNKKCGELGGQVNHKLSITLTHKWYDGC